MINKNDKLIPDEVIKEYTKWYNSFPWRQRLRNFLLLRCSHLKCGLFGGVSLQEKWLIKRIVNGTFIIPKSSK